MSLVHSIKPPPLLLGAALLFWGWQADFLLPSALMALGLEGALLLKARWDFSDQDFARIWTFCSLLFLAAALYAFTINEGPTDFLGFFQNPNYVTQRNAGTATARSAAALLRWLPMLFFPFMAAQAYSTREAIPLETISLILRRRWKKARQEGRPVPTTASVHVGYPFVALCLFAASVHVSDNTSYFWGLCFMVGWALWPLRARRFGWPMWACSLGLACALGYVGQRGVGYLQNYISNINPQWFSHFGRRRFDMSRNRTDLGRIGRSQASGQIVIRVEVPKGAPPPLLREASFRNYRGVTWFADVSTNDFFDVPSAPNDTTYVLLLGKTNHHSVNISCYLEGGKALLPLPSGCGRLENLMAIRVQKSSLGAVLEEGPGVVVFDAQYGPGPTIDSAANENEDLSVPGREVEALDLTIEHLNLQHKSAAAAMNLISTYFQSNFTYSLWQELPRTSRTNESPLSRFLLKTRKGHCEYFATAGVLLLRRAGIPARYAVGYAVHEGTGKNYVVRQRDAHAWCLVWDGSAGLWRDFDPTPASWVQIEGERASSLQWLGDLWSRIRFEISKFRWGQGHLRRYLVWVLVPALVMLLYQIIFRRRLRHRHGEDQDSRREPWPGLDSELYQLEKKLGRRGLERGACEPLSVWLDRLAQEPGLADFRAEWRRLVLLHYRYRFDPEGLSVEEREELRRAVQACLARLDRGELVSR